MKVTREWFNDPTKNMERNVPRLNEDPRACDWEGDRRRKLILEEQKYAMNRFPGWVQKWLREAETLLKEPRPDGFGVGDAVANTQPDFVPGVSEETFDYYDELVPMLLREYGHLIRSELMD